jgi:hypothetical protein
MAERSLVLNNVLCFVFSRINKIDVRQLKSVLCDFYLLDDIVAAKDVLVSAAESLQIANLPDLRKRRDGAGRLAREVDDIFSVIFVLDESKTFADLPMFVADSPDHMPSMHLIEGDLHAVMTRFDKLQAVLDNIGSNVNKSVSLVSTAISRTGAKGAVINTSNDAGDCAVNDYSDDLVSTQIVADAKKGPVMRTRAMEYFASTDTVSAEDETDDGGMQTVTTRRKRRRMLSRLQDGINQSLEPIYLSSPSLSRDATNGTTSARNAAVRTAQPSSRGPSATTSTQNGQGQGQGQGQLRSFAHVTRTGVPRALQSGILNKNTMIGISASISPSWKLSAAKPYVGKAVYCIDNVSVSTTANDLRQFVVRNGISVLSCFEVIPRRSRRMKLAGIVPTGRKAFRLCIASEDVSKLLNCELWPAHITVSKWVSKERSTAGTDGAARPTPRDSGDVTRTAGTSTTPSTSAAGAGSGAGAGTGAAAVAGTSTWVDHEMDTANHYVPDGGEQFNY